MFTGSFPNPCAASVWNTTPGTALRMSAIGWTDPTSPVALVNANVTVEVVSPEPPLTLHVTVVPTLMMMLLGHVTVVFG